MTTSARQMKMVWHTEAGEVLFSFPSDLSAVDAADVRELLELALAGIDRRAAQRPADEQVLT